MPTCKRALKILSRWLTRISLSLILGGINKLKLQLTASIHLQMKVAVKAEHDFNNSESFTEFRRE